MVDHPPSKLIEVLDRARDLGFLGPGPVDDHVSHARRYGFALVDATSGRTEPDAARFADIGSGGGVPGLVLATEHESWNAVLIDASQRRCSFLTWASVELGLVDRVEVWCARAEEVGHQPRAREVFDVVVARSFGPPATTLECASPLTRPGGLIVVSEPPEGRLWPDEGLAQLALAKASGQAGMAVFRRNDGLADRIPRASNQQQREPLFSVE